MSPARRAARDKSWTATEGGTRSNDTRERSRSSFYCEPIPTEDSAGNIQYGAARLTRDVQQYAASGPRCVRNCLASLSDVDCHISNYLTALPLGRYERE